MVKDKIRDPSKRTYNRRRRVLFPDVDGFRESFVGGQLDYHWLAPATWVLPPRMRLLLLSSLPPNQPA